MSYGLANIHVDHIKKWFFSAFRQVFFITFLSISSLQAAEEEGERELIQKTIAALLNNELQDSLDYGKKLLAIQKKRYGEQSTRTLSTNYLVGLAYTKLQNYEEALSTFDYLIQQIQASPHQEALSNTLKDCFLSSGIIHFAQDDYGKAASHLGMAWQILATKEKKEIPLISFSLLHHLMLVAFYNEKYQQALFYSNLLTKQVQGYFLASGVSPQITLEIANAYEVKALLNYQIKNYPEALLSIKTSLHLKEKMKKSNPIACAYSYYHAAVIYEAMTLYGQALNMLEEAKEIMMQHPNKPYEVSLTFLERQYSIPPKAQQPKYLLEVLNDDVIEAKMNELTTPKKTSIVLAARKKLIEQLFFIRSKPRNFSKLFYLSIPIELIIGYALTYLFFFYLPKSHWGITGKISYYLGIFISLPIWNFMTLLAIFQLGEAFTNKQVGCNADYVILPRDSYTSNTVTEENILLMIIKFYTKIAFMSIPMLGVSYILPAVYRPNDKIAYTDIQSARWADHGECQYGDCEGPNYLPSYRLYITVQKAKGKRYTYSLTTDPLDSKFFTPETLEQIIKILLSKGIVVEFNIGGFRKKITELLSNYTRDYGIKPPEDIKLPDPQKEHPILT